MDALVFAPNAQMRAVLSKDVHRVCERLGSFKDGRISRGVSSLDRKDASDDAEATGIVRSSEIFVQQERWERVPTASIAWDQKKNSSIYMYTCRSS